MSETQQSSESAAQPTKLTNEETSSKHKRRLRDVLWRDIVFLILVGVATQIVGFVETNVADASIRGATNEILARYGDSGEEEAIVDAGFIVTAPLHRFLVENRYWIDTFALMNSILLLFPFIYAAKVTFWDGDFTLIFRQTSTQLFRSLCGWFTYLPPSQNFLMSMYDFPEVAQCLFQDCSSPLVQQQEALPFVSFFSGHVASCVITANHLYIRGHVKAALVMHILNLFQIIRLLATRGHYSIDIIIGWCVAVCLSNPADRVGRYYSRGMSFSDMMPPTATDAFETITGVHENHGQDNTIVQSDTTVRVAADAASAFAKRSLSDLQDEFRMYMDEAKEQRRNDLLPVLKATWLKIEELQVERRNETR